MPSEYERPEDDPWFALLAEIAAINQYFVRKATIFQLLKIEPPPRASIINHRIKAIMRYLGWRGPRQTQYGYGFEPRDE